MPTGGGKSIGFSDQGRVAGKRVMVLAHRSEMWQTDALRRGHPASYRCRLSPTCAPRQRHRRERANAGATVGHVPLPDSSSATKRTTCRQRQYAVKDICCVAEPPSPWCHCNAVCASTVADSVSTSTALSRPERRRADRPLPCACRIFAPPSMDTADLHVRHGEYVTAEVEALDRKPSLR